MVGGNNLQWEMSNAGPPIILIVEDEPNVAETYFDAVIELRETNSGQPEVRLKCFLTRTGGCRLTENFRPFCHLRKIRLLFSF